MVVKVITDRISAVNVPCKNGTLLLMQHPASVILYKYVSISTLSGTVTVMGYEINPVMEPLNVFSSEKTGLIEIQTESFENIWKRQVKGSEIERHLTSLFCSTTMSAKVLEYFKHCTVAVYIQRNALPYNVEFAEFYFPLPFEFNLAKRNAFKECHYLVGSKKAPLDFDQDIDNVASEINICIRRSKMAMLQSPKILVCGSRNTGKSTLLKYLINRMLTQISSVCYLDTDPGQPEFTPPGVVSLSEVTKPLMGPSFLHQNENAEMVFVGDVSPSYVDLYEQSICKLMKFYSNYLSDQPLFVNTMGWMEGTGLQCLKSILAFVQPTILIEIVPEDVISMFDYRDHLSDNSQYYQICSKHKEKSFLSPKQARELSLLSYLGKSQSPYLGVTPLNEIRPHCVSWDKIPIFLFPGGNIPLYRLAEAINGSIVALCSVPDTYILVSSVPDFPKTLEPEPDNKCLAYGFVQSVDEKERLLYIISPLKNDEWEMVNAIIKGKVMVPDALVLQQELYYTPLPYTDVRETNPTDEEMADVSMVSLNYQPESEDESEVQFNSKLIPSLANFRKPVGKRYTNRFSKKSRK